MILADTDHIIHLLQDDFAPGPPKCIAIVLYRWQRQGSVKNYGAKGNGNARWSVLEVSEVADAYRRKHGCMPWTKKHPPAS